MTIEIDPTRRVALDALLEQLPSWLELIDGSASFPRFRDIRHGDGWRLFPGGAYEFGATEARRGALLTLQELDPSLLVVEELYRPTFVIELEPFFMMERVARDPKFIDEPHVMHRKPSNEVQTLAEQRGVRLPSEAEWEYAFAASRLEPEGWHFEGLELCADGWLPTLLGRDPRQPIVPGGPSVLRSGSRDPRHPDSVLPARRHLKGVRMASLRAVLDVPAIELARAACAPPVPSR